MNARSNCCSSRLLASLALGTFMLFAAVGGWSQEHPNVARGLSAQGSAGGGNVDNINSFNGNLSVAIPLGQAFPVNGGLSYGLSLVYNSQVWEYEVRDVSPDLSYVQALPLQVNNAGLGWIITLGRFNPPQAIGELNTFRNTYMSPDGSRHTFYPNLHEGEPIDADFEYARDGSYLRYRKSSRELEFPDGTIHLFDADGYLLQIRGRSTGPTPAKKIDISYLGATGAPAPPGRAMTWQISDGHRTSYVRFRTVTTLPYQMKLVDQIDLPAFVDPGAPGPAPRAVYSFRYNLDDAIPINLTGCRNVDPTTMNLAVALLTQVSLPDGTTYKMPTSDYYPTTTVGACKSGMLAKLTLPTLGAIAWDYIDYVFPTESTMRTFRQRTTGVGTRTLLDAAGGTIGAWGYTTVMSPPLIGQSQSRKELVNTTTDALGNHVVRYFSICAKFCPHANQLYEYGLPFTRERAGDGAGRLLSSQILEGGTTPRRTFYLRYERDEDFGLAPEIEDKSRLNQRLAGERTVFHEASGGTTVADGERADFDGYGHYRSQTTGGTLPGNNVRTAAMGYNPVRGTYGTGNFSRWPTSAPWILGTYTFSWESEGAQLFYRSYCFEPNNGFLLGRRVHAANDAGYRANDLVETYGFDGAGNITSENSFGGDPQPLSVDPAIGYGFTCGQTAGTAPTFSLAHTYAFGVRATSTVSVGGTLNVLHQTIDASTGLPSSSRDAASVQTNYTYDALGRPLLISPAQSGRTQYAYRNATSASSLARVTITQLSALNVTLAEQRMTFDALGRPTLDEERMPNGAFAGRRTNYNALGWKTFVSEQGALTVGTTYLNFDPFGRPGTIRPPDTNSHDVVLAHEGVRQVARTVQVATGSTAETAATTTELYDRFGRLAEVSEPNGTKTCYEYDAGDRLRRVCQAAAGAFGTSCPTRSCGQERQFGYDNRGFVVWENHPEKTANSFGLGHDVDYPTYDAGGNVIRKVDGAIGVNLPRDLTYQYDAAERLTLIRESGAGYTSCTNDGGRRCLKTFAYANSNGTALAGGTDFRKGKMVAASRFNFIGAPFSATDEVKTVYEYGGLGGRISRRDTSHVFGGIAKEGFRQSFAWGENGQLLSETYPDCITPTLCGASAVRTVGYGTTNGRLTSVTGLAPVIGFASAITYHANGMPATVVRANLTTDVFDRDPHWMIRPAAISTQKTSDGTVLWTTNGYLYDGSGNVRKMGTASFTYDSLSRLTSGTVLPGRLGDGIAQNQSQTFDIYGNITTVTTNTVVRNTPTATATNRLATAGTTYDAAGNLTAWSGNSYEHDAFNQMTRMVSGAEDWRYIYDANDERLWSYRINGGGSLWTLRGLNSQVLREYRSHLAWSNYVDSIFRGNALLATAPSAAAGGGINHLHPDHLGTPRLITNSVGAVAGFHAYYPFGEELAATFNTGYTDRQRFTGHERDLANATGQGDDLDYMHARHCSPIVGRFLSFDPIGGNPRSPQTWNRYAYVMGNPIKYVDPEGLFGLGYFDIYAANAGADALDGYGEGFSLTVRTRGTGTLFTNAGTSLFLNGLSYRRQIGIATSGPSERSGFGLGDLKRSFYLSGQGLGAFVDGVIPFVDPLQSTGVVDREEIGVAEAEMIGEYTRDLELILASTGSNSIFGGGTWANKGRFLRFGHSFTKGRTWFAIRGEWVNRLTGTPAKHIYLWIIRNGR